MRKQPVTLLRALLWEVPFTFMVRAPIAFAIAPMIALVSFGGGDTKSFEAMLML